VRLERNIKKVIKTQVSGAGAEEMYAPRLWYYNELLFLCDQETQHSSTPGMQEEEEEEDSEVNLLIFVLYFTLLLHLIHIRVKVFDKIPLYVQLSCHGTFPSLLKYSTN
jgi:hypothetical protein